MIELDLGLLADDAVRGDNGKLYIFGEFRYMFARAVPARHGRLAVVARFVADAIDVRGDNTLELEIIDQDGNSTSVGRSPKIALTFQSMGPADRAKRAAQIIVRLDGLLLTAFGNHEIAFFVNGTPRGAIPFHVAQAPPDASGRNL